MNMRLILALILSASLFLVACGDENTIINPGDGTDNGADDNGDTDDTDDGGDGTDPDANYVLGSGDDPDFEGGTLEVGMSPIASDGSTGISGRLLDEDGNPAPDGFEASFTSDCVADDLANIDSPISIINGEFSTTYSATGCGESDTITATVNVGSDDDPTNLTATGTVEIEPADLGSIGFVSAEPSNIGIRGMGGLDRSETSLVTFQVRDMVGGGIGGRNVSFSLSTDVGGIELSTDNATSGPNGLVSTTVIAGTVATPVRVNAQIDDTQVGTQSDQLTISTGIPSEDGFSVSASKLNPEALSCDGEPVEITVRARDRFSNPVVDGTAIQFNTQGGTVEPSCQTEDGKCSVTWTSQDPRPANARSSVLAFAVGEESFTDHTGDGRFGNPEYNDGSWDDRGEPFRDDNESGSFDVGIDGFFFDYNRSGERDGPNGLFDGVLCEADSGCGEPLTGIGRSFVITMSGSAAQIDFPTGPSHSISADGALEVLVQDINGNPMPAGTTVSVGDMQYGSVFGPDSFPFGSTSETGPFSFTFELEAEEDPGCGTAFIEVTTPGNECSDGTTTYTTVTICD